MKMRSILLGVVLGMAAGSIAFAEPDPAYADQMVASQSSHEWQDSTVVAIISGDDMASSSIGAGSSDAIAVSAGDIFAVPEKMVQVSDDGTSLYKGSGIQCWRGMLNEISEQIDWHPC